MTVVERKGMIGIVKGSGETDISAKRKFLPQSSCQVEGENDGYPGRITRMPDNVTRYY